MFIYDDELKEYNFRILLDFAVSHVFLLSKIRDKGSEFELEDLFPKELWDFLTVGQKRALGYLFNNEVRTSTSLSSLVYLDDPHNKSAQLYKFK